MTQRFQTVENELSDHSLCGWSLFADLYLWHVLPVCILGKSLLTSSCYFKGQVQGLGWFLTRFPLKFAENNDVGETVIMWKTGIFCRTESIAKTLKIMCTYAHYVTLGSRCKMANNHRVTDLEKNPVRISKDEAPTPLLVAGPLFISSLLFPLSRSLLGAWRFSLFSSVYSSFHNSLPFIGVLISQFILVCFIICKNEKVLFVLVQ